MNMNEILDTLANNLAKHQDLQLISFYFDEAELSPNSISFPCIQFQPLSWRVGKGCEYERELQIRIIVNTRTKRDAIIELYNYEVIVRKAVSEIMKEETGFELDLIGGTQIAIKTWTYVLQEYVIQKMFLFLIQLSKFLMKCLV